MPLWRIFHPEGLYTPAEKAALAQAITKIYAAKLPAFYVNVLFVEYAANSFFIAGQPATDFVRFVGEHIARNMTATEVTRMRGFMGGFEEAIAPWTAGKGVRWETHIDQTPFDLWRINGLPPPPPDSDGEKLWKSKGLAVPYEGMVSKASPPASAGTNAVSSNKPIVHGEMTGLIDIKA